MTGERYRYRICGLVVESDFRLEEAEPAAREAAAIRIRRTSVPPLDDAERRFRIYAVSPEGDLLAYDGMGRFLVPVQADRIDFEPDAAFDLRRLGLPLLGPVFALLLHRRGRYVLHGSAVEIGGRAHVFLGDKGAGKSTTAAALVAAGHRLIADDVVALDRVGGGLAVHAGYPAMKLDREMLPRFHASDFHVIEPDDGGYTSGKCRVRLHRPQPVEAVPLARLHTLARGASHGRTRLGAPGALQALIRFAYHPRFGGPALAANETTALFARAAELAAQVQVDSLTVKDSLAEIAGIAAILEAEHDYDRVV